MAVFEYRGLDSAGKTVSGFKEADSPKTLRTTLRKDGVFVTDVLGQAEGKGPKGGARLKAGAARAGQVMSQDVDLRKMTRGRVTSEDVAIMTRQLSTLLSAGVTLVEALAAMVDQVEKEELKRVVSDVKQRVNEGSSLGDALQQHVKIFGKLYVNMIRAGETSGALDSVLLRLAEFTEGQAKLQGQVIGALIYPLIMMCIGGGVLALMMIFVIPNVAKIFIDMKASLPWTTQTLIFMSDVLRNWWYVIFPSIAVSGFAFWKWTGSTAGKPVWDKLLLKMPVFGNLVRILAMARFSRTLATLLKSGVPVLGALEIVKNVITNTVLSDVVDKARDSIREGESISAPLKRSGEFPPLVYHMVAIGERSGQLEDMLLNVADSYETQSTMRINALMSLLSPVMIVGMAGFVAFVAISILMPMLRMNQLFAR